MFPMEGPFNSNPWPSPVVQHSYFGGSPPTSIPLQAVPWGTPGQVMSAFGPQNGLGRQNLGRSSALRQLLIRACEELAKSPGPPTEDRLEGGFVSLAAAERAINERQPPHEQTTVDELMEISDTLGNAANGGGTFDTLTQSNKLFVRWEKEPSGPDGHLLQRAIGARISGQIGSAAVGSGYGSGQGGI